MAEKVTNYQCPSCTGPLHFAGSSGKLECEYCGSSYEVAEIEEIYKKKEEEAIKALAEEEAKGSEGEWDFETGESNWADEEGLKAYNCPSCGAELICDEHTVATSCPYCNNPTVVAGKVSGMLKPDYVIPFKYDKKAAVEALKNHYKGKKLLPKEFTANNHIEEVKGVYVPFWLFNGEADASAVYKATRSFTHRRGEYEVITTQHFVVKRRGNIPFEKIPVDASSKMPDEYMDSIEPFDYSELKPFSTAYLPGYFADKYDVKAEASIGRAETRIENTALECLRSTVKGYLTCVTVGKNVNIKRGKAEYALLPVWVLCTKWNGQNYLFTMNGQTGKLVGDLPVSMQKFWTYFFAIAIPLMVIFALAMLLI